MMNGVRLLPACLLGACILALGPAAHAAPPSPSSSYIVATAPSMSTLTSPPAVVGFTSAPLPNVELSAPRGIDSGSRQASLKPRLYQPKNSYHGDGFVWGSTVQTDEEKHLRPTPGVGLSVPLD